MSLEPDFSAPCAALRASHSLTDETTIVELQSCAYWELICPWLHASRDSAAEAADARGAAVGGGAAALLAASAAAIAERGAAVGGGAAALHTALIARGYFNVAASETTPLIGVGAAAALDAGVLRLVALGHAPTTIMHYDEAWSLVAALTPLCVAATGNDCAVGDIASFCVSAETHAFGGPHRDKPGAGAEGFRADGSARYDTVWVALSAATPISSCLYFLDSSRDAGFHLPGDALREALGVSALPGIVAQPCEPGGLLCFSHRTLHWGSDARSGTLGADGAPQRPRTALSFALSDAAFTPPLYDAPAFAPFPPLALRVALRAGQAIAYHAQSPLSRAALALDRRTFASARAYFSEAYVEKVMGDAQNIAWARSESDRRPR
jgi:hypothetical protein